MSCPGISPEPLLFRESTACRATWRTPRASALALPGWTNNTSESTPWCTAPGVARDAVLWKMAAENWNSVMSVNLDSAFHLLHEGIPRLRMAGGGSVVLISSINGERGKFGQANYVASKAGLIGLARTAAREVGAFGIRVNVVSPGMIATGMTEELPSEVRRRAVGESALGQTGTARRSGARGALSACGRQLPHDRTSAPRRRGTTHRLKERGRGTEDRNGTHSRNRRSGLRFAVSSRRISVR